MKKLKNSEKTYIILIIILLLILCIKSLVLDEYKPKNDTEVQVLIEYYQQSITNSNILKYKRVVNMTQFNSNEQITEDSIKYKIKVRTYLFGIIPYWEKSDYVYN